MAQEVVSTFRLNLMRAVYLLTFLGVGVSAWTELFTRDELWGTVTGAAFSFWAAYSVLMGLGARYPLKMLPLLVLQLFYKSVWMVAVALPLWSAGRLDAEATRMAIGFAMAMLMDLIVIPWPYVLAEYVKMPGDRWRAMRTRTSVQTT